jgi:small-conductance mechanosensitive channel
MGNILNGLQGSLLGNGEEGAWLGIVLMATVCAVVVRILVWLTSSRLRKLAEQTTYIWDDIVVDVLEAVKPIVVFVFVIHVFSKDLHPPEWAAKSLLYTWVVGAIYQMAVWGNHALKRVRQNLVGRRLETDPSSVAVLNLVFTAAQGAFIGALVLLGLSNIGVDISALLAGVSIGGVAVALAAQSILGDLLASLSIVLDKPFAVGDLIAFGTERGTVEHVGIKTTRLRCVSGEELVVSNKELLASRIQNFQRIHQRQALHRVGVLYSTPLEKLEQVPGWVKAIVESYVNLSFVRCSFCAFGSSALEFEIAFFVNDPDGEVFMAYQEKVLFDILKKFSQEGVQFAFPTQTIHIESVVQKS